MARFDIDLYSDAQTITPSDSAFIAPTKGIMIGATGTLAITTAKGTTLTITGLAVGTIHPISAIKVLSTGTTATNIVSFY